MNIREEVTNRIISAIEGGGVPPWRKGWTGGELAVNSKGVAYRGVNQLLLGMSGFTDNRWYTFRQIKMMEGLHVRKGEHSTKIVRMVEVEHKAAEHVNSGEVVAEEQGKALVMRLYDVFNAVQIEGMASRPERAHAIEPVDAAEAMVEGMKRTGLSVRHGFPGASYSMSDDLIRMPDKENFHSTEDFYATLLHESAHATGSHKRLQRLVPTARFGSAEYAKEELRAELAAAMLCADLGIGQAKEHLDNHAAYVASWLEALKQDRNEIFRASADAQRAFDYIKEHAVEVAPIATSTDPVQPAPIPQPTARHRAGMRA
jgi:antirestriction protein ArdC